MAESHCYIVVFGDVKDNTRIISM